MGTCSGVYGNNKTFATSTCQLSHLKECRTLQQEKTCFHYEQWSLAGTVYQPVFIVHYTCTSIHRPGKLISFTRHIHHNLLLPTRSLRIHVLAGKMERTHKSNSEYSSSCKYLHVQHSRVWTCEQATYHLGVSHMLKYDTCDFMYHTSHLHSFVNFQLSGTVGSTIVPNTCERRRMQDSRNSIVYMYKNEKFLFLISMGCWWFK